MCKKKEFYYECHKRIKIKGETLAGIAGRYGVHRSGLQRILKYDWDGPKAQFVREALCRYLDMPPPQTIEEMTDEAQ